MNKTKQKDTKMTDKLSIRQRLANLNEKLGYARVVCERLKDKGIIVQERTVYLVVNGVKRKHADDILLEVEIYVAQREKHKADIEEQRKLLQTV